MFVIFALLSTSLGPPAPKDQPLPDEREVQRHVELARGGDRMALVRLYRWHVPRVYRAVRPWCRSDADAEDVTQETFVRALDARALARYEPMPGARFVSWLLTIARNTAKKRGKALARTAPIEPEELGALLDAGQHADDADHGLELSHLRRALLALLGELDDRDRWVLCLRYGGELEVTEVAELTGLSQANVRKICERQRKRVLARLTELGWAPSPSPGSNRLDELSQGAPA
jgi:RNA polymerase sigma factor (sigma-70 family)